MSTPRQLHALGLVTNYGPKPARTRREMGRIHAAVRKVLLRTRRRLWLWCDRNVAQSRACGRGWLVRESLALPYCGTVWGIGGRALVCFRPGRGSWGSLKARA